MRVFVVDDEHVIASTLAAILKMKGFEARDFSHAPEALKSARLTPPDLLISDVVMPEMTGIELAIGLKEAAPACKVLLFSGQAATTDLLNEARSEGHEFTILLKPIHPDDLLACIGTMVGQNATAW